MRKKKGANTSDQGRILNLANKGYKPEEISEHLGIDLQTVKNFMPEKQEKSKAKTKAINKKAGEQHKKIMDSKKGDPVVHQPPKG